MVGCAQKSMVGCGCGGSDLSFYRSPHLLADWRGSRTLRGLASPSESFGAGATRPRR